MFKDRKDAGQRLAKALEIERRIKILRDGKPLPEISDRVVILVDDGLAMGSTMRSAVMLCRNKKAKKVIVAVPVAGEDVAQGIEELVDEIVVLDKPFFFYAVAQAYRHWYDVPDEEVVEIMRRYAQGR